jgi:hypothetical protein
MIWGGGGGEHLFSCEVLDREDNLLWTPEQEKALSVVEELCAKNDCSYFRVLAI